MIKVIERLSSTSNVPCWIPDCPNKASVKVPDDCMDTDICEQHFREEQLARVDEHRFDWRLIK